MTQQTDVRLEHDEVFQPWNADRELIRRTPVPGHYNPDTREGLVVSVEVQHNTHSKRYEAVAQVVKREGGFTSAIYRRFSENSHRRRLWTEDCKRFSRHRFQKLAGDTFNDPATDEVIRDLFAWCDDPDNRKAILA